MSFEKSLRGNVLCAYSADPADGVVIIHPPLKSVSRWCLRVIKSCLPPLFSAGRSTLVVLRNVFTLRHCLRGRAVWTRKSIGSHYFDVLGGRSLIEGVGRRRGGGSTYTLARL